MRKFALNRLLIHVLNEAKVVTFPSERLCKYVLRSSKSGEGINKAQVIPHIGLTGYKKTARIPDGCFRICHAGNLSFERDPNVFFEGMARFVQQASMPHAFEFLIIGASSHELNALAKNYGIEKYLKCSGGLSYPKTLAALEQSDVLVVVEAPCKEGIFLPSKVSDYAQVGRPVLAVSPPDGTMADLIHETHAGELAESGNPESVANAISALYKSWRNGQQKEEYPSNLLWGRFRPEKVVGHYEKIFPELLA
jgi:glycosyltransferase involved in cell wall biosynthesis